MKNNEASWAMSSGSTHYTFWCSPLQSLAPGHSTEEREIVIWKFVRPRMRREVVRCFPRFCATTMSRDQRDRKRRAREENILLRLAFQRSGAKINNWAIVAILEPFSTSIIRVIASKLRTLYSGQNNASRSEINPTACFVTGVALQISPFVPIHKCS